MNKRQLLLMSSSRLHGFEMLEHARDDIDGLLKKNNVKEILFIPYALPNHDKYTKAVSEPLKKWGYNVVGIHTKADTHSAINNCEAIFIGGGNTFVLLKSLYEKNLIDPIRKHVLEMGKPYISASAGTNVATRSIHTTNDMPVVYPPSFNALNLVPFNINPHYIETDPSTQHKGETRDQRLQEFLLYNQIPVIGLREGSNLFVDGDTIKVTGLKNAKYFHLNGEADEYPPGSDLSSILKL